MIEYCRINKRREARQLCLCPWSQPERHSAPRPSRLTSVQKLAITDRRAFTQPRRATTDNDSNTTRRKSCLRYRSHQTAAGKMLLTSSSSKPSKPAGGFRGGAGPPLALFLVGEAGSSKRCVMNCPQVNSFGGRKRREPRVFRVDQEHPHRCGDSTENWLVDTPFIFLYFLHMTQPIHLYPLKRVQDRLAIHSVSESFFRSFMNGWKSENALRKMVGIDPHTHGPSTLQRWHGWLDCPRETYTRIQ